jgi:hypothetical protein
MDVSDYVMVGAINYEFDVPSEKNLTTAKLNRAIGSALRYIHFPVVANEWGAYYNHYTPNFLPDGTVNPGAKVQCYFVTDGGNLVPSWLQCGVEWYTTIPNEDSVGKKHYLNLEEQEKQQLKSKLKVTKNTAKAPESKQAEVTTQDKKRALEPDQFTSPKTKQETMEVNQCCYSEMLNAIRI